MCCVICFNPTYPVLPAQPRNACSSQQSTQMTHTCDGLKMFPLVDAPASLSILLYGCSCEGAPSVCRDAHLHTSYTHRGTGLLDPLSPLHPALHPPQVNAHSGARFPPRRPLHPHRRVDCSKGPTRPPFPGRSTRLLCAGPPLSAGVQDARRCVSTGPVAVRQQVKHSRIENPLCREGNVWVYAS